MAPLQGNIKESLRDSQVTRYVSATRTNGVILCRETVIVSGKPIRNIHIHFVWCSLKIKLWPFKDNFLLIRKSITSVLQSQLVNAV
jgi:hypothetical protein